MYRLDVSDYAEQDFDRIIAYIAEKLAAPVAAADFADAVYNCYDNLENNPFIYEQCRDAKLKKRVIAGRSSKIMFWCIKSTRKQKWLLHTVFSTGDRITLT